jgi:hypothetical protein
MVITTIKTLKQKFLQSHYQWFLMYIVAQKKPKALILLGFWLSLN